MSIEPDDNDLQLHPLVRNGLSGRESLTGDQLRIASNLVDELKLHITTPKPIDTPGEPLTVSETVNLLTYSFTEGDYIQVAYSRDASGRRIKNDAEKVSINVLSRTARNTIATFNDLSKSLLDDSCRDVVQKLVAKPQP